MVKLSFDKDLVKISVNLRMNGNIKIDKSVNSYLFSCKMIIKLNNIGNEHEI